MKVLRCWRNLCHFVQHGGEVVDGFGEVGVGLDERFVVLECGFELVVEVLLAGLGLLQCLAEPLVLLPECDSHEVDGFVSGVFEVAVGMYMLP